jgi:hypothetical protein
MDSTFFDSGGRPIAYSDDGRNVYAFSGHPLAYLEGDSVFTYDGQHLGWWDRGWIRDHHGACVLFTEAAIGGPPLPARHVLPAKGFKNAPPARGFKHVKPVRAAEGSGWSMRSGAQFFQSSR